MKLLDWSAYWLEALDPAHRPGQELHKKFNVWAKSASTETFWEWLDTHGKDVTK